MALYYRASCVNDDAAIRTFHSSTELFDSVPNVTSVAIKRSGADILFKFDDSNPVALRLVEALQQSGLFEKVRETDAADFDSATSNAV